MSILLSLLGAESGRQEESAEAVPTPAELRDQCQTTLEPFSSTMAKDDVVESEPDRTKKLWWVACSFSSQVVPCKVEGEADQEWRLEKRWHDGVIFIPPDPAVADAPERRGKVVIVGSLVGPFRQSFLSNYGDPIATRGATPPWSCPIRERRAIVRARCTLSNGS